MSSGKAKSARAVRRGFTMIEVIVMIVILGVLAAVIAPRLLQRIGGAKQATAASNASGLAALVHGMAADMGKMPDAGTSITILWESPGENTGWKGPYVSNPDQLKDPWGNLFVLVIPGHKNVDFDVVSYGFDGQPGGDGENEDIVKP